MVVFRATTIKRTRSRKVESAKATTHSASNPKRSHAAKRSAKPAAKRSTATASKRTTSAKKSASKSSGAKKSAAKLAVAEHSTKHDLLTNLIATAIRALGAHSRRGVSRPKIRQWIEEHLVAQHTLTAHTASRVGTAPRVLCALRLTLCRVSLSCAVQERELTTPVFRQAMSRAKEKGLIEQLLQHFILTDKAKKEMKLKLIVGSKKAEERMEPLEGEVEVEEEEEEPPAKPATKKRAASKSSSTTRGKAATKRAASTKSSGGRAKKAKTSTA